MRCRILPAAVLLALVVPLTGLQVPTGDAAPPVTAFLPIDVYIDSGALPLAAYQFEVRATAGEVRIVGIEGGAHPAFDDPPYYDPAAMQEERVIIADFSTAEPAALPFGRTRIATIHVHSEGRVAPVFTASLTVAATVDGTSIDADITTTRRNR